MILFILMCVSNHKHQHSEKSLSTGNFLMMFVSVRGSVSSHNTHVRNGYMEAFIGLHAASPAAATWSYSHRRHHCRRWSHQNDGEDGSDYFSNKKHDDSSWSELCTTYIWLPVRALISPLAGSVFNWSDGVNNNKWPGFVDSMPVFKKYSDRAEWLEICNVASKPFYGKFAPVILDCTMCKLLKKCD